MGVFVIDILHAGFVVPSHSAGSVAGKCPSSGGTVDGQHPQLCQKLDPVNQTRHLFWILSHSPPPLALRPRQQQKKAHLTLNFVIFPREHGCLMLNTAGLNSWKVGFLPIRSKYERLMKALSCLRTSVACLEFSGRVSGYASVVNWFLSSRQSPTVGRIAPLLAVVGLYGCRHSRTSHWAGSKLSWLHFGKLAELN